MVSQKKQLIRVHSPVGLDIGSETVPEIAISIISEIINHYRKGNKISDFLIKIMNKNLLKNGIVIHSDGQSKQDILIENNKIAAIGDIISVSS